MKCKLALQIFSHTLFSTMKSCIQTGQLKSKSAIHTADILETLNDLFDILNSKTMYSKNPYQSALSEDNLIQYQTLVDAKLWSEKLEKVNAKGKSKPPSFKGLTWSINAILELYQK